jgi:mgtE-like transporter
MRETRVTNAGETVPMSAWNVTKAAYRGALPTLIVSAAGGLLAGSVLSGMDAELEAVPGLLVMVPAFLAIRGSVYGSLGSRLSSGLHQGLIEPAFEVDERLANAAIAAVLNGLLASLFAAVLTVGLLSALDAPHASLPTLVFIALVGGGLAGLALTVTIVVVVFTGFRRGMNPDNLVGAGGAPAGDVFGMASLFLATRLALM